MAGELEDIKRFLAHFLRQGFAYTQFYDVEQEKNGLFTFNREAKLPKREIKKVNEMVDKYVKERYGEENLIGK